MAISVIPSAVNVRPKAVRMMRTSRVMISAEPRSELLIVRALCRAFMAPSLLEISRADVRVDLEGAGPAARRERRPGRRLDLDPADERDVDRRGHGRVGDLVEVAEREARDPGAQRLHAAAVPRVPDQGPRRRSVRVD